MFLSIWKAGRLRVCSKKDGPSGRPKHRTRWQPHAVKQPERDFAHALSFVAAGRAQKFVLVFLQSASELSFWLFQNMPLFCQKIPRFIRSGFFWWQNPAIITWGYKLAGYKIYLCNLSMATYPGQKFPCLGWFSTPVKNILITVLFLVNLNTILCPKGSPTQDE